MSFRTRKPSFLLDPFGGPGILRAEDAGSEGHGLHYLFGDRTDKDMVVIKKIERQDGQGKWVRTGLEVVEVGDIIRVTKMVDGKKDKIEFWKVEEKPEWEEGMGYQVTVNTVASGVDDD